MVNVSRVSSRKPQPISLDFSIRKFAQLAGAAVRIESSANSDEKWEKRASRMFRVLVALNPKP
jgi:hypothetical protein